MNVADPVDTPVPPRPSPDLIADAAVRDLPLIRRLLAGVIRQAPGITEQLRGIAAQEACAIAEDEGLVALVADALADARDWDDSVPVEWSDHFRRRASELAALDMMSESEFLTLLDALQAQHRGVLLMKGAHLAYSYYARSDLRPRLDSDLLIPLSARRETEEALRRLGYEAVQEQQEGDLLRHQVTLVKTSGESRFTVDLHWRALDPPIFAEAFDYHTLADASVEIPRLGPMARGLHPVHALLLACVHRVAHHREHRPLIWVYDIHLLASTFGIAEWRRFLTEAERFRVGALCKNGLELAVETFGTQLPDALLQDRRFARRPDDTAARYLEPTRRADIVVGDLQALPDWRSRLRLIAQYLFPRAEYMRQTYAPASRLPLPLLYLVRIGRGAGKWFVKSAGQ